MTEPFWRRLIVGAAYRRWLTEAPRRVSHCSRLVRISGYYYYASEWATGRATCITNGARKQISAGAAQVALRAWRIGALALGGAPLCGRCCSCGGGGRHPGCPPLFARADQPWRLAGETSTQIAVVGGCRLFLSHCCTDAKGGHHCYVATGNLRGRPSSGQSRDRFSFPMMIHTNNNDNNNSNSNNDNCFKGLLGQRIVAQNITVAVPSLFQALFRDAFHHEPPTLPTPTGWWPLAGCQVEHDAGSPGRRARPCQATFCWEQRAHVKLAFQLTAEAAAAAVAAAAAA